MSGLGLEKHVDLLAWLLELLYVSLQIMWE